MELRQLRYFRAVVELLSFSGAAKRLRVGRSSVSREIKSLERELGAKLLDRSRFNIALTDAGDAFYREICRFLADLDFAVKDVRQIAAETGHRKGSALRASETRERKARVNFG
jgi:DNA-binding transcriptional LysR family regulator